MISGYLDRFHNKLNYYFDLMEKSWGYRPKVEVKHEWLVRVGVKYGGLRNKKFFIKQSASSTTRHPARIATRIITPNKKIKVVKESFPTADSWIKSFHKEYEKVKLLDVSLIIDYGFAISVDFNIDGFAHKGQRVYVTQATVLKYRKPESVARLFAAEITSHRNTCRDCGIGVLPINRRVKGKVNGNPPPDAVEEVIHPKLSKLLKKRLEGVK